MRKSILSLVSVSLLMASLAQGSEIDSFKGRYEDLMAVDKQNPLSSDVLDEITNKKIEAAILESKDRKSVV